MHTCTNKLASALKLSCSRSQLICECSGLACFLLCTLVDHNRPKLVLMGHHPLSHYLFDQCVNPHVVSQLPQGGWIHGHEFSISCTASLSCKTFFNLRKTIFLEVLNQTFYVDLLTNSRFQILACTLLFQLPS